MKLVMFSGGLDSTGALYKLLTETDEPIHAHYIFIRNIERRGQAELRAVEALVPRLQEVRTFTFTQSMWGFAQFNRHFVYDAEIVFFVAAQIALNEKRITHMVQGITKEDMEVAYEEKDATPQLSSPHIKRAWEIYNTCFKYTNQAPPLRDFPVEHMSKKEVWQMLPEDIREHTWSCRHPRYRADGQPAICGVCRTCKQMMPLWSPGEVQNRT